MEYKLNINKLSNNQVEVYGTPKKDKKGIRAGQDMRIIANHIWGDNENSKIVRYENVVPFPTSSIVIKFISGNHDDIENRRRAKLLISVYKFARKNVPITQSFFPKRNENNKINEDYENITLNAATLYKKYHESQLKETTSSLRMLDKALNQQPSTKILSSKQRERDKAEKLINKMLKEDIGIINAIDEVLTNTLYVDERGDVKSIGGKEIANQCIRRIIKRQFLKRYKITK